MYSPLIATGSSVNGVRVGPAIAFPFCNGSNLAPWQGQINSLLAVS